MQDCIYSVCVLVPVCDEVLYLLLFLFLLFPSFSFKKGKGEGGVCS